MDTDRNDRTPTPDSGGAARAHARVHPARTTPAPPRPKRVSRRRLQLIAGLAAAGSFALPFAVMRAVPMPPQPQAAVPRGGVVVVHHGTHSAPVPAGNPVSVTRASGAPPP